MGEFAFTIYHRQGIHQPVAISYSCGIVCCRVINSYETQVLTCPLSRGGMKNGCFVYNWILLPVSHFGELQIASLDRKMDRGAVHDGIGEQVGSFLSFPLYVNLVAW